MTNPHYKNADMNLNIQHRIKMGTSPLQMYIRQNRTDLSFFNFFFTSVQVVILREVSKVRAQFYGLGVIQIFPLGR